AEDRVRADTDQSAGLADATAIGQVSQHGLGLVVGQAAIEQRRALAFGETCLAGLAIQQASLLFAIAGTDGHGTLTPLAVAGAVGVLTAEAAQVGHHRRRREKGENNQLLSLEVIVGQRPPSFNTPETPPHFLPSRQSPADDSPWNRTGPG